MEDPRWLRLITIGLILAALAVGYFLLSGRLISNSSVQKASQVNKTTDINLNATPSASILGQNVFVTPSPSPEQIPGSVNSKIVNRDQSQVRALPKTGFSQVLIGIVSIGVIISGWGLRRFPH